MISVESADGGGMLSSVVRNSGCSKKHAEAWSGRTRLPAILARPMVMRPSGLSRAREESFSNRRNVGKMLRNRAETLGLNGGEQLLWRDWSSCLPDVSPFYHFIHPIHIPTFKIADPHFTWHRYILPFQLMHVEKICPALQLSWWILCSMGLLNFSLQAFQSALLVFQRCQRADLV
jgi:hypothetical protein